VPATDRAVQQSPDTGDQRRLTHLLDLHFVPPRIARVEEQFVF